jgi:hypothetical protein
LTQFDLRYRVASRPYTGTEVQKAKPAYSPKAQLITIP